MTIFYFTATGNSLAVAKSFGGKLISIPQVMDTDMREYSDEAIGLVFPIYGFMPPKMVRKFLEKVKLNAKYIFAIGTYGNMSGATMYNLQNSAQESGNRIDYAASLLMVDNYLPMYSSAKEREKLPSKKIQENLQRIKEDITNRKVAKVEANLGSRVGTKIVNSFETFLLRDDIDKKFIVDDRCTLCKVCSRVCPAKNISVSEKVNFHGSCESCYACIHLCPHNAIHLKKEKDDSRWINPEVTLGEIVESNNRLK